MRVYEASEIRNVALVGHGHAGKTSLAAGLLYTSGATNRLTRADEGNTLTDYDEEEIARKLTISTSLAYAEWKKNKINLLDTPGFNIFVQDARAAMIATDGALIVVDGVAGVEVQTEKVWRYADEFKLPTAFYINKLDRERADFDRSVDSIQKVFGRHCLPVQIPMGAERDLKGIIDVVEMKALHYKSEGDGKATEAPIPADFQDAAELAHEALVEMIAEGNDELMEEFFATSTLPVEHIQSGLHAAVRERRIVPILCGSALHNMGSDRLMDFVLENFPAPGERCAQATINGKPGLRPVSEGAPASVYVFKTTADPFAGRVSCFKVMTGILKNDAHLLNARSSADERLSHLGALLGKTITPVAELRAGDLGAVAKLRDTITGDTLSEKGTNIVYTPVQLPEPSIAYAISAKTRNDEDRMGHAIHKILDEDLTLRFYRDPQTKEFLLAGNGQQHIEIICSRLKRRYGVEVTLHAPKIPYRETIRGRADVQGRHKKQSGGHGQFGDCKIKMEPLDRGRNFEFVNAIFGGAVPRQFVPAIEKGILEAAARGYLAGFPVVDFRVTLYDGSYHDVDSSEMAFKIAGRKAFRAAMEVAKPGLLEPVMKVEVQAPVEYAGDLMSDMNSRRGRISGMDTKGPTQVIRAFVPMAEMLSYQNDLISMTQGRATFTMEFDHYDSVPALQAEKVIASARASGIGQEEEDE